MLSSKAKQLILGAAAAGILMASSFAVHAGSSNYPPRPKTTNINLAVVSNFYGFPPSNSAITDIINAFMADNPKYTVTVVDNGATSTLARLGQPDGISPSRMAEMLEVDKAGPIVRC